MTWRWQRVDLRPEGPEEMDVRIVDDTTAESDLKKLRSGKYNWITIVDTETYYVGANEHGFNNPNILFYWNDGKET